MGGVRGASPDTRGEYIDGEFVESPTPTRRHQTVSLRLARLIQDALPDGFEVIEHWGWKPGDDEFAPDIMVFATTDENVRYTGIPQLVVEILSSDPARDTIRKFAKYAAAGVGRYWIVDVAGPEIIEYHLDAGAYVEQQRVVGGHAAGLDVGPVSVHVDPAALLS